MNWYHDISFGLFDNITCLQHRPLRCDTMKNEENCRKRSISNSFYTKRIDNRYSNEFTIKASTLISFIISTKTRSQKTSFFGCDSNQNLSIISQKLSNNFLSSRQWRQKRWPIAKPISIKLDPAIIASSATEGIIQETADIDVTVINTRNANHPRLRSPDQGSIIPFRLS